MTPLTAPDLILTLPAPRWWHRGQLILVLALASFFAVITVQYFLKIHHNPNRSALLRWSGQIQDLCRGENIWHKHNYPNPPIMALILVPLAHLPHLVGAMTWFACKAALGLAAMRWVWRMLGRQHDFPLWAKLVGLLLVLKPFEGDLVHGNVNLFILFLLAASLYAFTLGRDFSSGLLLGLAISCKLTPALFIPYFLWKGARQTLLGCLTGLVLFLGVVPSIFLGVEDNAAYLRTWVNNMVLPYVAQDEVTSEHQNQSLPGLLHRLLTHSASFSRRTETAYIPLEYHNILDLDPTLIQGLVKALMLAFLLLMMWACRTPLRDRGDWRLVAEFSLVMLGMLLFSERTWKHHCVTLLFPCAVLGFALAHTADKMQRRLIIGSLAAAGLLMVATSSGLFPGQGRFGDLALVYGAYVWALLIMTAPLVWLLRHPVAPCNEVAYAMGMK